MNESYDEDLFVTNLTLEHCQIQYANQTALLEELYPGAYCGVTFDSILCWPPTPVNESAVTKCFSELFNIKYDDTRKYDNNI